MVGTRFTCGSCRRSRWCRTGGCRGGCGEGIVVEAIESENIILNGLTGVSLTDDLIAIMKLEARVAELEEENELLKGNLNSKPMAADNGINIVTGFRLTRKMTFKEQG